MDSSNVAHSETLESDPRSRDPAVRRRRGGKVYAAFPNNTDPRRARKTDKFSDDEESDKVPLSRRASASNLNYQNGNTSVGLRPHVAVVSSVDEEDLPTPDSSETGKTCSRDDDKEKDTSPTAFEARYAFPSSSVAIVVTERIREFLQLHLPEENKKQRLSSDRIDLDELLSLVQSANKHRHVTSRVNMAHLVEGSYVIERKDPPPRRIDHLPFSEQLRIQAEERRHQAAVKSLWGERKDKADCFADLNRSLGMGINAVAGLFLTFLGGYWGSLYCGILSFQNRVVIGMVLSIICMLVEVFLFAIYDAKQQKKLERERKFTFSSKINGS